MSLRIFDISENQVVVNEHVLLVPELKAIVDNYEDPIPPLCYVYYMTEPFSPYFNLPAEEKEERILEDYEGDYTSDDELIFKAVEKLSKLCETPTMRLFRQSKVALLRLGNHLESMMIRDEEKGGNLATLLTALKSIAKINEEYSRFEKQVEEEYRTRGNSQLGYDEI